jgi:hypothetical protein
MENPDRLLSGVEIIATHRSIMQGQDSRRGVGVQWASVRNPRLLGELPQAARRRSHWRKRVLDSVQAMSLLAIMEIIGPVLLIAVLIYGTIQWSRRRRGPTQAVREEATRQLYRDGAKAEEREAASPPLGRERPLPPRDGTAPQKSPPKRP